MDFLESYTTDFESLPIVVVGKPRMTQRDKWAKRKPVLAYRAFCDELIRLMKERNRLWMTDLFNGEVSVIGITAIVLIPMPQSWSGKKKERMAGTLHDQKPDSSNIYKAIEDAICVEDKQVSMINLSKFWTCGEPRVDIKILWKRTT